MFNNYLIFPAKKQGYMVVKEEKKGKRKCYWIVSTGLETLNNMEVKMKSFDEYEIFQDFSMW